MPHRVLGNDLVSLIFCTTGTFHSQIAEFNSTDSRAMEHNALKSRSGNLSVKRMFTTNTRVNQIGCLNNGEPTDVLQFATIGVKQSLIVSRIRHQGTDNRRVTLRGQQAVAVSLRHPIVRESRTSLKKSLKDNITVGSRLSNIRSCNKLKCFTCALSATRHIRNVSILICSVLSRLIGDFINNSTISRLCKSLT